MGRLQTSEEIRFRLRNLGARLRAARQYRRWTIAEAAAKAGINRNTLGAIERGMPGVAMGAYVAALWALGLDRTLEAVANPAEDARAEVFAASVLPARVRKRTPR